MSSYRHISVAIPMLGELDNLPQLLQCLSSQSCTTFEVYICVNNPASWSQSTDAEELALYEENMETLRRLEEAKEQLPFALHLFNSQWVGKQKGVGWARKTLFDTIAANCDDNELIVSLDADTTFSPNYLSDILTTFNACSSRPSALAVPYYHHTTGNETSDRSMLRYEIYMRHHLLNLAGLNSRLKPLGSTIPYVFTALGSAMAFPVWSYRRVGGITPLQGGEDFYLLQKYAKTGLLLTPADLPSAKRQERLPNGTEKALTCPNYPIVFPSARPSHRVPFGTGPAISKGLQAMDETYPLYPHEAYTMVGETYTLFPELYDKEIETPMSDFLRQQLRCDDIWAPLRKNFKSRELFIHACAERVDGLRILQFLRLCRREPQYHRNAEEELTLFCKSNGITLPDGFSFQHSPISDINSIRNSLFQLECSVSPPPVQ